MLFQNKCLSFTTVIFVCALLFVTGCNPHSIASPQNYQINNPRRTELGKTLNEISGLCYNVRDSSLLAISDSKSNVFELDIKHNKLKDYTGAVLPINSDVEDIAKVDTTLFLLLSKGEIVEVPAKAKDSTSLKRYALELDGQNDFESLYYDPTANGLIMLCKSCEFEQGTEARTAYRFDLATRTFDKQPFFTLDRNRVKNILKNDATRFTPSAAAIHPINKRLYILSAPSNLLAIADTRGEIIEVYELNPDDFPKAEGITFAPNGDMYISNEAKFGRATLLCFPYQGSETKK